MKNKYKNNFAIIVEYLDLCADNSTYIYTVILYKLWNELKGYLAYMVYIIIKIYKCGSQINV